MRMAMPRLRARGVPPSSPSAISVSDSARGVSDPQCAGAVEPAGPRGERRLARVRFPQCSASGLRNVSSGKSEKSRSRVKQRFDTMGNADRGDACIVDHGALHSRPLHEACEELEEVAGLADEAAARRCLPRSQLRPCLDTRARRRLPDPPVGDHTHELVDSGPGNRPVADPSARLFIRSAAGECSSTSRRCA